MSDLPPGFVLEDEAAPVHSAKSADVYADLPQRFVPDAPADPRQFGGPRKVSQDTAGAADILDVAVASLAEDPDAKIRWYAARMGIREDRFGIVGGQIVYIDGGGRLQAVAPGMLRELAKGVGPSFPAVGGAVGTAGGLLVGAPSGPGAFATATGSGGLGAMAGQAGRDWLAREIMGQPMSSGRLVREGVYDLAATAAGLLVGKGVSRALATRAGREMDRLIRREGREAMDALKTVLDDLNAKYRTNLTLTPAEISNAAKLRAQQMTLEGRPEAAQRMEDYYADRGIESERMMGGYLDDLSPSTSADEAGELLSESAEAAMRGIKAARVTEGSAAYRKAFDETGPVDIEPAVRFLDETSAKYPPAREILDYVRDMMGRVQPSVREGGAGRLVAETDLKAIQDTVKEALDDEIKAAYRVGKDKLGKRLGDVQKMLLKTLDEQSPKYAEARRLWGDLSRPVSRAEGGILPVLSRKTAKDFEYLGTRFFGTASPEEIARARAAIIKTKGGEDSWNAALKGFLGQRWEDAGRVYKSKIARPSLAKAAQPSAFWADMTGNGAQKERLRAALSPDQRTAFEGLMDVFKATGRATNYNSTTAAQLQSQKMLDVTGGMGAAAKAVLNPSGIPRRAAEAIDDILKGMNLDTLVDVITSTDSVKELVKARSLAGPRMMKFILTAKALNLVRAYVGGRRSGPDRIPPFLLTPPRPELREAGSE